MEIAVAVPAFPLSSSNKDPPVSNPVPNPVSRVGHFKKAQVGHFCRAPKRTSLNRVKIARSYASPIGEWHVSALGLTHLRISAHRQISEFGCLNPTAYLSKPSGEGALPRNERENHNEAVKEFLYLRSHCASGGFLRGVGPQGSTPLVSIERR